MGRYLFEPEAVGTGTIKLHQTISERIATPQVEIQVSELDHSSPTLSTVCPTCTDSNCVINSVACSISIILFAPRYTVCYVTEQCLQTSAVSPTHSCSHQG